MAKRKSVEEWLDEQDLARLEWQRIQEDLYPERHSSAPTTKHVYDDEDPVMEWLSDERSANAEEEPQ